MIIRMFQSVRRWELKHKIANVTSLAYAIFGIALPSTIVFGTAKLGEDYFRSLTPDILHPDALIWILFGSCIISNLILWFYDE